MNRYARAVARGGLPCPARDAVPDPALQPAHASRLASGNVDALAQYGFRLTESARTAGLEFVHEAPTLDAKLAHIMPQVASMGAAVSIVDFDRDGLPDLYVTDSKEGSKNQLYPQSRRRHVRGRRARAWASPI